MKLYFFIQRTPLFIAIEKENLEIVKLILANEKLEINIPYILNYIYY